MVGAPGVGLQIRWGCAPPPVMHQPPVLPPLWLDVEPVCTQQDVTLLEDRQPSGLPALLQPIQGRASLGHPSTGHGLALGLPRAPPRVQGPRAHLWGPLPSGAAPADCHLPPAPMARYPFPSRAQASGPRLQGLVKTTGKEGGRLEGRARPALMDSAACHQGARECPLSRPRLDRPAREPGGGGQGAWGCSDISGSAH